jgi:hypothetical protein
MCSTVEHYADSSGAADFQQLEAERLDLGQHPVQGGLVGQRSGEYGLGPARLGPQVRERAEQRAAQQPAAMAP